MKKVIALLFLTSCLVYVSKGDSWTQKSNFGGSGRSYLPAGFSIGTKAYVGLGYNGSTYYTDLWEWDQTTDVWTQKANFTGGGRYGVVSFAINGKGYVGTGKFVSTNYNTFYEYNPVTNTWTQKANFPGTARCYAVGFSIGNKGYIGSGGSGTSTSIQYNDFYEYNQATNTWTAKSNFPTLARTGAVGISVGNKGYVGLGWIFSAGYQQDFWEYDTTLNTWIQQANFLGGARTVSSAFSIGNKAYVGMGYNGSSEQQNFFEWDQSTNTWTARANFGGGVRSQTPRGMAVGGKGYAGLGYTGSQHMADWWEYDPLTALSTSATATSTTCNGTCDGTATVIPNGGLFPYSYMWSNGQTTATATGLCAGSYTVTVTDANSDVAVSNVTVTEPPVLTLTPTATTPVICAGACTILNANVSGGTAGYLFTWSPGGMTMANPTVCPAATTTYTCTVTDANGCVQSNVVSVTVNDVPVQPTLITGNNIICEASAQTYAVVNDPGATGYTWSLPATWSGTSSTNSITPLVGSSSGIISVTANNSCGSSAAQTMSITVNPIPLTPGSIAGLTTLCSGNNSTYSVSAVSGATSYTWVLPSGWTGSSATNSINPTAGAVGGNITVSANNACGSSSVQTLAVAVITTPSQPSAISGNITVCEGSSQLYSVTNDPVATTYTWTLPATWSGASTTNTINSTSGSGGGPLTVTAGNTCGTSAPQSINVIVNPLPVVTLGLSTDTICADNIAFVLTGGLPASGTYSGTGVSGGVFNATTAGVGTHTITYTFTDGNNCTNVNTDQLTVINCIGISDLTSSNIAVFPNPSNGIITLLIPNGNDLKDCNLLISDVMGKIIYSAAVSSIPATIDISETPAGVYVLYLRSESQVVLMKLIKE